MQYCVSRKHTFGRDLQTLVCCNISDLFPGATLPYAWQHSYDAGGLVLHSHGTSAGRCARRATPVPQGMPQAVAPLFTYKISLCIP